MYSSSNSKRRRVDKKQAEHIQDVNSTQKSHAFITKISVKLIACIFDFLRFEELAYCQRVNKLFHTNSSKAIQGDKETYAMYCVKKNNLDIIHHSIVKQLLLNSSKADEKNQSKDSTDKKSTENQSASENDQTENMSNLSLISSRADKLLQSGNKLKDMLSKQPSVEYILNNSIDVVKSGKTFHGLEALKKRNDGDTFISIEFPISVISPYLIRIGKISAEMLLYTVGIKYCDMKNYFLGFQHDKWNSSQRIVFALDPSYPRYYTRVVQRQIMRIILTNDQVLKYFNLKSQDGKTQKNLLLLDWDETLYYGNKQRPHLIQFLQCVTKFCVIFINTAGCEKERYISDLNKNEGVDICGVFHKCDDKQWLNEWIKRYHWCNIDEKYLNFLLIDDQWRFGTNLLNIPEFQGCSKDDVLLKLIPWLEEWYKYTSIDKKGTTNQFIKSHSISFKN